MSRSVRVSARAVLADEGRLLLNHLRHERTGDFYELPGGGVRAGEGLHEAVAREVREETGYTVTPGELLWVREHVAASHEHAYLHPPGFHGLDLMFRCSLAGPVIAEAHAADDYQVGVEWVSAPDLADLQVFPPVVVPRLRAYLADRTVLGPTYLREAQEPSK